MTAFSLLAAAFTGSNLIYILVALLVLWLIYWGATKFLPGTASQIVGVICFIIFIIIALGQLGVTAFQF